MPGPKTTLLIEGTFKELVEELAEYIDNLHATHDDVQSSLKEQIAPLLEQAAPADDAPQPDVDSTVKDKVLDVVVKQSGILASSPEREFIAAYNLLIHLIFQSTHVNRFLPPICQRLSSESASISTKASLVLTVLTTIFNAIDPEDAVRFHVFSAILEVISESSNYESLRPQLRYLDAWLVQWQAPPAQHRRLYLRIAGIARDAGEPTEAYEYLIKALRTIPVEETSDDEARKLSTRALRMALESPTHFDFEDLTSLDSVQALRNSDSQWFDLLDVFTSGVLEDYNDFKSQHGGWLEQQGFDDAVLVRKMRLLTIASLAAQAGQARSLPYESIARALAIPLEDVEMWVIDVIRVQLVEGKLSQLNKTFLIHRSTYRVFTQTQWREVAGRLDLWRTSLTNVLQVIRQEKQNAIVQQEQETRAMEAKANGATGGGGGGGGSGAYRRARDVSVLE